LGIKSSDVLTTEDEVGFRYEAPILITKSGCEVLAKIPLEVTVLQNIAKIDIDVDFR